MKIRIGALAATFAITSSFIAAPLSAVMAASTQSSEANSLVAQRPSGGLLQNLPFSEDVEGYSLDGTVTISEFSYGNGQLLASGVLNVNAVSSEGESQTFSQSFSEIPVELTESQTKQVCDILFLDLGPIFLDVLGLTVDLSAIELDIDAVSGSGNLLGNLLCQLVSLLDGGPLSAITNLLEQINDLLN